jgi:hypothetical protein
MCLHARFAAGRLPRCNVSPALNWGDEIRDGFPVCKHVDQSIAFQLALKEAPVAYIWSDACTSARTFLDHNCCWAYIQTRTHGRRTERRLGEQNYSEVASNTLTHKIILRELITAFKVLAIGDTRVASNVEQGGSSRRH